MKDHEERFSFDEEFQTINLLPKVTVEKYKKKYIYTYIYIRFDVTQVALQPLTTSGLDCAIFVACRENRSIRHKDSLFAMIQRNICYGPIYCSCCPKYWIDLNVPRIIDTLLLDIYLPNIQNNLKVQCRELSRNFAITYRVCFKLLLSQLNPKCILKPSLDETMLVKAESDNIVAFTTKLLKENKITISYEFIIQNTRPRRNIAQKNVQQIIEEPNGRVFIRFNLS